MRACVAVVVACVAACDDGAPTIVAGERIDDVALGATWDSVRALVGSPVDEPVMVNRVAYVRWPGRGLEAVFVSPDPAMLTAEAVVIGVATTRDVSFADLRSKLGDPSERSSTRAVYAEGLALELVDERATRTAVFAPIGARRDSIEVIPTPEIVDGPSAVVDMHLHPGSYQAMAPGGRAFITDNLPRFLQVFAPDLIDRLSDPWAPHVGIAAQTAYAGANHVVLFAVYAPASTGTFTNEALVEILRDARNRAPDGLPWAWGMASIDFTEWSAETGAVRFAALRDLLASERRLVGIKLAFAHQGVTLDDAASRELYAIAAELDVPILHHTGFSPFPGTKDDPRYYDPTYLEGMLEAYPEVDVVLSHVGQGDARSLEHALDLASRSEHVWLELSALGRPLLVDAHGSAATSADPQYPYVLAAIRSRGLIGRTLFASDGPQYPGFVRGYVERIVGAMRAADYTPAEIEAVMAGNFYRLYRRAR